MPDCDSGVTGSIPVGHPSLCEVANYRVKLVRSARCGPGMKPGKAVGSNPTSHTKNKHIVQTVRMETRNAEKYPR